MFVQMGPFMLLPFDLCRAGKGNRPSLFLVLDTMNGNRDRMDETGVDLHLTFFFFRRLVHLVLFVAFCC